VTTLKFKILRDKESQNPDDVEWWVYENIEGTEQRTNYLIIRMNDRSAFIPLEWVVEVHELK